MTRTKLLLFALLFISQAAVAQQALVFGPPSYSPQAPSCSISPILLTQTVTYPFTVYDCSGKTKVGSGTISATGQGYCSGLGYWCGTGTGVGQVASPTFVKGYAYDPSEDSVTPSLDIWNIATGLGGKILTYGCGTIFNSPSVTGKQYYTPCSCSVALGALSGDCKPSPIILDTKDEGFHLTGAEAGTLFRATPEAAPMKLSWLDPRFGNGWLVRPNPDGSWTDMSLSRNLFGNLSPQPPGGERNGYRALAYWAAQEGCGEIDHLDARNCSAVWNALRVWTDNGDGIVQPSELHTLSDLGYTRVDLRYRDSRFTDAWGDQFRYTSTVRDDQGHERERSYDVFCSRNKLRSSSLPYSSWDALRDAPSSVFSFTIRESMNGFVCL